MRDSGWTGERRAARSSDELLGGSHAHNYGKFVKRMFNTKPDREAVAAAGLFRHSAALGEDDPYGGDDVTPKHVIEMAKLEQAAADADEREGKRGGDNGHHYDDARIDALLRPQKTAKPPLVYQTKSSAEYMNLYCTSGGHRPAQAPPHRYDYKVQQDKDVKTAYGVGADKDRWRGSSSADADDKRAGTRTVLVDYSRLPKTDRRMSTNYNFRDTSFLRRTDSRIVGGDFVVVSLHRDPWYDKVDRLLEDVRNTPRF